MKLFGNNLKKMPITLGVVLLGLGLIQSCNPKKVENYDLKINEISPNIVPRTGGSTINITGSGFQYLEYLIIDEDECADLIIVSDTLMRCTVEAHESGEVVVVAQNVIGEAAITTMTFKNVPVLESITPDVGTTLGGTVVILSGSGFEEGITVLFGNEECDDVEFLNENTITCTTQPKSEGFVSTVITNPDGEFSGGTFFAFRIQPTISSITPSSGSISGGTLVTITGTGFSSATSVKLGSSSCTIQTVTSTSITCTVAAKLNADPSLVDLTVFNNTGLEESLEDAFTYL